MKKLLFSTKYTPLSSLSSHTFENFKRQIRLNTTVKNRQKVSVLSYTCLFMFFNRLKFKKNVQKMKKYRLARLIVL